MEIPDENARSQAVLNFGELRSNIGSVGGRSEQTNYIPPRKACRAPVPSLSETPPPLVRHGGRPGRAILLGAILALDGRVRSPEGFLLRSGLCLLPGGSPFGLVVSPKPTVPCHCKPT